MTNTIEEIVGTDFIFAIGTNTTENHPIISLKVRKALTKGAQLVVADPRRTEMAEMSKLHLQHQPGSDLPLLNAMAHVIIAENLYDKEFVATRTEGFKEFKEAVKAYTPEYASELTGLDPEAIRQAALGYAQAENAMILYTMGITQHICGTDNVLAIANLALLTGHIGKEYNGVCPLRGQNNVQGACDMGALPDVYPGYQKVTNPDIQAKFEKAWGVPLSAKVGLTVGEMLEGALSGSVRGMYIIGENPVVSDPDANHVVSSLNSLDFLVVQDIFLTETAKLADVVLPAASYAEKSGIFSNTERRVQLVRQAIEPVGESKPDWEIIAVLGNCMGGNFHYANTAEIMDEIAQVTPSYGGISHTKLEQGSLHWPCPTKNHPGTPILHQGKFSRGLGKFSPVSHVPPSEQPDKEYPFILTTGRRLPHYHTGTMTRRTGIEKLMPEELLELNPKDAARLGIANGERVKISSRRGKIEVKVIVTDMVQEGLVFATFHFAETAINKLTNSARDPVAKIPEFKVCAVKIEKIA
jgi:formate dehydrogenase major subunit